MQRRLLRQPRHGEMTVSGAARPPYTPPSPEMARAMVRLSRAAAVAFEREWEAMLDGGLIGLPAPSRRDGGDYGLASLEAILSAVHRDPIR